MVQVLMGGELHAGSGGRNRETTKFAALLLSPLHPPDGLSNLCSRAYIVQDNTSVQPQPILVEGSSPPYHKTSQELRVLSLSLFIQGSL